MNKKYFTKGLSFLLLITTCLPLSVFSEEVQNKQPALTEIENTTKGNVYRYTDGSQAIVSEDKTTITEGNSSLVFENKNEGEVKSSVIKGKYRHDTFMNLKNVIENSLKENNAINTARMEIYDNEKNELLFTYYYSFTGNQQNAQLQEMKVYNEKGDIIAEGTSNNHQVHDKKAFKNFQKTLQGKEINEEKNIEINSKEDLIKARVNEAIEQITKFSLVAIIDDTLKDIKTISEKDAKNRLIELGINNFICDANLSASNGGEVVDINFPEKCIHHSAEEEQFSLKTEDIIEGMKEKVNMSTHTKLECDGYKCQFIVNYNN